MFISFKFMRKVKCMCLVNNDNVIFYILDMFCFWEYLRINKF